MTRFFAVSLAIVKLVVVAPLFLGGCIGIGFGVSKHDPFAIGAGLLMILGAVGLGYPFSLIHTTGLVAWPIIGFATVPLFVAISHPAFGSLFVAISHPAFGLLKPIVVPWLIAALADFVLSRRRQPAAWSPERCAFVFGCGVVFEIVVMGVHVVFSQGQPYRPPVIAFQGESKDLRQSTVVPTLDTPMPTGKNVVWCGTIQLGWNRLGKDVLHAPPTIQGAEAVVSRLNKTNLVEDDLPPESYLATAGFVKDGIVEKVKAEMKRRFQKEVEIEPMESNGILAYAYLQANAAFTIPFFDNRGEFHFRDSSGKPSDVTSFGIEEKHEYAYHRVREQIDVLYLLRNDKHQLEEFILDLCRSSSPNQIILACVPPKATLLETLKGAEKKTQEYARQDNEGYRKRFGIRDVLLVPNLNWEVRHRFAELEGKRFTNAGFSGYHIEKAMQTIRFRLDRSGAELSSEFQQVCKPMATYFVLDRPFMIVVKKRGAERPFFVMWVDNAELLCKP